MSDKTPAERFDQILRIMAHAAIPLLALCGLLLLVMLSDTDKIWGFACLGAAVLLLVVVERMSRRANNAR